MARTISPLKRIGFSVINSPFLPLLDQSVEGNHCKQLCRETFALRSDLQWQRLSIHEECHSLFRIFRKDHKYIFSVVLLAFHIPSTSSGA
ncbi:MAG: hypothetical protein LBV12_02760 [Puniceicoccales bacterium]|nr:hypothetical protein [Puniceicoccales bacterium]